MIRRVEISRLAAKRLRKVPRHIVNNLIEHWDHVTSVAFSPEGDLLVSGTADGILHFWGISEAIPMDTESAPGSP